MRLTSSLRPSVVVRVQRGFLLRGLALAGVFLTVHSSRVQADPPSWERPLRAGIADQDAEIARGSAKAVASRLESQASRNRQDFVVHYLLARAFGKDNQRANAISAYAEALALEAGCWFAWRDRGVLRWLEKDLGGAEQDLRQAETLNPRFIEAIQPLGALLIEQKRFAEGIMVLERALDVDSGLDSARLQIADAFLALGRANEALETLDQLLRRDPQNAQLRVTRAKYLVAKGDYPAAQKILKQLAIENPNNPAPLHLWLDIAVKAKTLDPDEGIWVLEQLRRLSRTAETREKITKQIQDLRRQAAAVLAPPVSPGRPTPEMLARALRSPEVKAREAAVIYILTGVTETFTITGDLTQALIERLDWKRDDSPRVRALTLEVLSRYGTPEFASVVRDSLRDPDGNCRRKAADALGQLKNPLGIAALWRYATGPDLDLAVSARLAVYALAQKSQPAADESAEAQATAFSTWWTSIEARDAKKAAITAVPTSPDRAPDELLFPLAFLDADEAVSMAAYDGLKSLLPRAEQAAKDAKANGKEPSRSVAWMLSLPILDPAADPSAAWKPYKNAALGSWWMKRP